MIPSQCVLTQYLKVRLKALAHTIIGGGIYSICSIYQFMAGGGLEKRKTHLEEGVGELQDGNKAHSF